MRDMLEECIKNTTIHLRLTEVVTFINRRKAVTCHDVKTKRDGVRGGAGVRRVIL